MADLARRRYRGAAGEGRTGRRRQFGRDCARGGATGPRQGRARQPRRCAGGGFGGPDRARRAVVAGAGSAWSRRGADAAHARRSGGSPPLPQRRRHLRAAARGGRSPGGQRERQRRDRGNPLRRQRPAGRTRGSGGGRAGRAAALRCRRPLRPRSASRGCQAGPDGRRRERRDHGDGERRVVLGPGFGRA